jgi:hypothetical protein
MRLTRLFLLNLLFYIRTGELRGEEQGSRTKALSRSPQRRSSIAAPVHRVVRVPLGCHPLTNRS